MLKYCYSYWEGGVLEKTNDGLHHLFKYIGVEIVSPRILINSAVPETKFKE
jgi:hypothetical protein